MPLISVNGDMCDHGAGAVIASQSSVFVNNKPVIVIGDSASPDSKFPSLGPPHNNPATVAGSGNVFVTNKATHRQDDGRVDGSKTIVTGQATVYANG